MRLDMADKVQSWLKSHQYVASWTTLAVCVIGLYEITKLS